MNNILDIVKNSLLIPLDENYADDELNTYIESCKQYIIQAGANINTNDNRVNTLIIIYCKTYFGFKNDGSVKELPSSFDMLLRQIILSPKVGA